MEILHLHKILVELSASDKGLLCDVCEECEVVLDLREEGIISLFVDGKYFATGRSEPRGHV